MTYATASKPSPLARRANESSAAYKRRTRIPLVVTLLLLSPLLVGFVALMATAGTAVQAPHTDELAWKAAVSTMGGHLIAFQSAQILHDTAGMLNAQDKLLVDCAEAQALLPGSTDQEQTIRGECSALGAPLP